MEGLGRCWLGKTVQGVLGLPSLRREGAQRAFARSRPAHHGPHPLDAPERKAMKITFEIQIQTISVANSGHGWHWYRSNKRTKREHDEAWLSTHEATINVSRPFTSCSHVTVLLTRVAPRKLDDDNLRTALKSIRDGVADALGIDDGDDRITFNYDQGRRGRNEYAVIVDISTGRAGDDAST